MPRTLLAFLLATSIGCGAHGDASCDDGACDSDAADRSNPTCYACACATMEADGGCWEACDGTVNGTGEMNFCNEDGVTSSACEACVEATCGAATADCQP
jgi:hypothetical protein